MEILIAVLLVAFLVLCGVVLWITFTGPEI